MQFRTITGEERDQLLSSRKPSGFNYNAYLEVLDSVQDSEVVAVDVPKNQERGEKIRFSRAARIRGKSLNWLSSSNANEIAFQIGPAKTLRPRVKKATQS